MIYWKDVVGFEGYLKVSSCGLVFSKRSGKVLKQFLTKSGYFTISTRFNGRASKPYCFKVHRLVAEAFLEKPPEKLLIESSKTVYGKVIVNHKDSDKLNNKADNLEWCNHKFNTQHAFENQRIDKKRKLSFEIAEAIRLEYSQGETSHRLLSIKYNVSRHIITKLLTNKTYNY